MRLLVADDEAPARGRLRRLLTDLGHEVVGEAADGAEALALCRARAIDVALLDIRMPGMDGLACAAALAELPAAPAVIFVTAHEQHALEAFEAHAVDYLLKPVRGERLARALSRAKALTRAQLAALAEPRPHLVATYRGGVLRVPIDEVLYLRAEQKYVVARHTGGEALLEDSLRALEERFGGRFVRIHRNALVARDAVAGLAKDAAGTCFVRVRGIDDRLEVSRRHLPEIRAWVREG